MNNKKKRPSESLTVGRMVFKGAFVHNPVLTQAIGLCPIVAIGYNIKAAGVLSLVLFLLLTVNELLACLVVSKLPHWLRISCYLVLSTAAIASVMPILGRLTPGASNVLGIYLPLLTVSSLVVIRSEKFAVGAGKNRTKAKAAAYCVFDSFSSGIGFAAVILVVSAIRQSIASPGVFGIASDKLPSVNAMTMPFGGLIVLGFVSAAHKAVVKRFFPEEPVDTFDFSTSLRSPILVDPGLHATQGIVHLTDEPMTQKDKLRAAYGLSDKDKIELEVDGLSENTQANTLIEKLPDSAPIQVIPLDEDGRIPQGDTAGYVSPDTEDPYTEFDFDPDAAFKQEAKDFTDEDVLIAIPVDEDEQDVPVITEESEGDL